MIDKNKLNQKEIKEIVTMISDAITHHEKMKNYYFFSPPSNSYGRRHYEDVHTMKYEFSIGEDKYCYDADCRCSCSNVYFADGFYINGEKKNVRLFKKLLEELQN